MRVSSTTEWQAYKTGYGYGVMNRLSAENTSSSSLTGASSSTALTGVAASGTTEDTSGASASRRASSLGLEAAMGLTASGLTARDALQERTPPSNEDMEIVTTAMDGIASLDLSSMDSSEMRSALEDLQSSLTSASTLPDDLTELLETDVSALADEEVEEVLAGIQSNAQQGMGPGGMKPMMGPPPGPPPDGAAADSSVDSTTSTLLQLIQELTSAAESEETEESNDASSFLQMLGSTQGADVSSLLTDITSMFTSSFSSDDESESNDASAYAESINTALDEWFTKRQEELEAAKTQLQGNLSAWASGLSTTALPATSAVSEA